VGTGPVVWFARPHLWRSHMTKSSWVTIGTLLAAYGLAFVGGGSAFADGNGSAPKTSWGSRLGTAHLHLRSSGFDAPTAESQRGPSNPSYVIRGQGYGCPNCGGAGCGACGGGMRAPGHLRAATMGWMSPNGCGGCQPNGFPPEAAAYPYPYGGDPSMEMGMGCGPSGGYMNLGDTCCGPDWFDFMFEGVVLTRNFGTEVPLISDGIRGFGPPNTVLSASSADFDYAIGYRATGRFQMSAVNALEASYMGGLDWDNEAGVASDINSLYSVFSDFGNNPFGGFEQTDQASFARVTVDSELDSLEVNYRRGWVAPNHRVGGAWYIGARWIRFKDSLVHNIIVEAHDDPTVDPNDAPRNRPDATFDYSLAARNDLVGPQLGTDMNFCLIPGLVLGGDAKVAAYGNTHEQNTRINASTAPNSVFNVSEFARDTSFAYGSEGRAYLIWQFHPMVKFRGGYEVLFADRIATAAGNVNTQSIFDPTNPGNVVNRVVDVDDNDQLLVHGFNFGLELGW
jgi:hypothetical protein